MSSSPYDVRICFIGDSFVNGTMDGAYQGWIGRLCAKAATPQCHVTLYNLGIRRETSQDIALRWYEEAARRLPQNVDGRLVFSFGVNDCTLEDGRPRVSPEHSLVRARQILTRARAWLPVLWVGPPPVASTSTAHVAEPVRTLSARFQELALELDVPYCDLHAGLARLQTWEAAIQRGDGVHPDASGYELIQRVVENWSGWQAWWAG